MREYTIIKEYLKLKTGEDSISLVSFEEHVDYVLFSDGCALRGRSLRELKLGEWLKVGRKYLFYSEEKLYYK